jgi:hypothetical protein
MEKVEKNRKNQGQGIKRNNINKKKIVIQGKKVKTND